MRQQGKELEGFERGGAIMLGVGVTKGEWTKGRDEEKNSDEG
jgi:hypothetical protein